MKRSLSLAICLSAIVVGCAEPSSPSQIKVRDGELSFGKALGDPTATVKLPLSDAGLKEAWSV